MIKDESIIVQNVRNVKAGIGDNKEINFESRNVKNNARENLQLSKTLIFAVA